MKWKVILRPENWLKKMGSYEYGIGEPVLFELDEIEIYDCIDFEGKRYVCGHINLKKGIASVKEIPMTEKTETNFEYNLVCPFCGHSERDSWELSDDEDEYECGNCSAILSYEREVQVTYSAKLIEAPKIRRIENE